MQTNQELVRFQLIIHCLLEVMPFRPYNEDND